MEPEIEHWITIGMSKYHTPGFQDTSRLMTAGFHGDPIYIEPPDHQSTSIDLTWKKEADDHITVFHAPPSMPRKFDPLRLTLRAQTRRLDDLIKRQYGADWRKTTALYVTNWSYYQQPLVQLLKPKYLVFDVVDDVLAFPYSFNAHRVLQFWKWFAKRASATIAVSPVLKQLTQQQLGVAPRVLPNGVDAHHFTGGVHEPVNELREYSSEIKVGFAGTLNHWIDFHAMHSLLEHYPKMHLFLSGKEGNFGTDEVREHFQALRAHPRAHFLGPVEYKRLPDVLHGMDILFLPRIPSPSSESSSPLKLFEYLAVGKPIVSIGVPIDGEMDNLIYHSPTIDGLFGAMNEALREGVNQDVTARRQEYAKQHTWSRRVKDTLSLIH